MIKKDLMKTIILIPARLASTRLPNKPLADIAGEPMIVRVWRRAIQSGVGQVVVACDSDAIAQAITHAGGKAVLTDPNLPSGSDRIYQALSQIDPDKTYDAVINVQGDMPTLDPNIIKRAVSLLDNPEVDIGTLASPLAEGEAADPNVVKVTMENASRPVGSRATAFSRSIASCGYHHIGIYAYKRAALEKFVTLPPSENELSEKLEQLRAMDNGMRIDVALVDTVPLGVDTMEGLEKARKYYEAI